MSDRHPPSERDRFDDAGQPSDAAACDEVIDKGDATLGWLIRAPDNQELHCLTAAASGSGKAWLTPET